MPIVIQTMLSVFYFMLFVNKLLLYGLLFYQLYSFAFTTACYGYNVNTRSKFFSGQIHEHCVAITLPSFFALPVICNVAFDVAGLGYNKALNVLVIFAADSLSAANFTDSPSAFPTYNSIPY